MRHKIEMRQTFKIFRPNLLRDKKSFGKLYAIDQVF
jgi:hypothetical protein